MLYCHCRHTFAFKKIILAYYKADCKISSTKKVDWINERM